jgi:hypothetical protein
LSHEPGYRVANEKEAECVNGRNTQATFSNALLLLKSTDHSIDEFVCRMRHVLQLSARIGKRNPSSSTFEQWLPDELLKAPKLLAQCGLSQAEDIRRFRQRQALSDFEEKSELLVAVLHVLEAELIELMIFELD